MNRMTPGIYRQELTPAMPVNPSTGVPAFLGFCSGPVNRPQLLHHWMDLSQDEAENGEYVSYLSSSVRGFFKNGGRECYRVNLDASIDPLYALQNGLDSISTIDAVDLVCVPDIMMTSAPSEPHLPYDWIGALRFSLEQIRAMQELVLAYCGGVGSDGMGMRFAILDSLPGASPDDMIGQRAGLSGQNGALYYPWIGIVTDQRGTVQMVPPCGHLAGVYARTDEQSGVYSAPANKSLNDAVALEEELTNAGQAPLNADGINCLRSFPGRGILVWGARSLSARAGLDYVNQRRLMITFARWLTLNMSQFVFEPNEPGLWGRISRELTAYLDMLFLQGALAGSVAEQAFYVKCDSQTNPPSARALGQVVAEVGLAPAFPAEFVVVKIVHDSGGTYLTRDISDLN